MNTRKYLELRCIQGRNLVAADSNGLSDPYIQAYVGGSEKKKQKTKVIKKTLDPNWNQLLTFEVYNPDIEPIHITVFDKDLLKSDFLGEVEIEIDDLIEGYEKVITVPLNRVRTGEITIGLKAVNWSGSKSAQISNFPPPVAAPAAQSPFYQPGFYNHQPGAPPPMFQFPSNIPVPTPSRKYEPVPFIPPLNAAQMIPGYNPPAHHVPSVASTQASASPSKARVDASACREGYNINYNEIKFIKKIGAGAFGEVWKGEWAGTDVAIKKILKADISESDLNEFSSEILLMSKLRHPNIVQFLGACMDPEFCLLTEFMSRGSLFDIIGDEKLDFNWSRKVSIALDVAKGLLYLHSRQPPIVHRDIKSLNVLVTKDWKATVADFGLTKIKDKAMLATRCGSPAWSAPEVLRGEPYDEKADVFSYGIVLWEILSRSRPYPTLDPMQLIGQIAFQKPSLRPPIPECDCSEMIDLMIRCWHDVPNVRPTFELIVEQLKEIETATCNSS